MTVDIFFQMEDPHPFHLSCTHPGLVIRRLKKNVLLLRLLSHLIVESATIKNMGLNSPQNIDNFFT